jgi:Flp pilus assembly protein TadD
MPTPDDTQETLVAAGRSLRAIGDLDAAARVFTRAHHLDPTAARPLVERGAIAILQHRYDEALADYQGAEQFEPHYPGLASYFAELYLYTNRAADALRISENAAVEEPGNLMHRMNIAHAQLLLGNTDVALDGYRDLADEWHPTKRRSGREQALQDLRLLDDAGITVPAIERARAVLDPITTDQEGRT